MPPNRTADHQVRDRRFSTSKPAVFYAPVLLRPAAGWWYSWPSTRTSQVVRGGADWPLNTKLTGFAYAAGQDRLLQYPQREEFETSSYLP